MTVQRKKILVTATMSLIAVMLSALVFWPKPTIENSARSIAYRVFRGDSNVILELTPESDLKNSDVTKENWKKFVESELVPRLIVMKISGEKLKMPANNGLVGVFYFIAGRDGMNRDLGVGVETNGDGVVVPMSVWIGMFSSAYSVVDLKIPDLEVASRTKEIQTASLQVLQKYGIKKIVIGSHVKDLSSQ